MKKPVYQNDLTHYFMWIKKWKLWTNNHISTPNDFYVFKTGENNRMWKTSVETVKRFSVVNVDKKFIPRRHHPVFKPLAFLFIQRKGLNLIPMFFYICGTTRLSCFNP